MILHGEQHTRKCITHLGNFTVLNFRKHTAISHSKTTGRNASNSHPKGRVHPNRQSPSVPHGLRRNARNKVIHSTTQTENQKSFSETVVSQDFPVSPTKEQHTATLWQRIWVMLQGPCSMGHGSPWVGWQGCAPGRLVLQTCTSSPAPFCLPSASGNQNCWMLPFELQSFHFLHTLT